MRPLFFRLTGNKMSITAEIEKVFRFEAAHFLPNVPSGHQCQNIHGHSYKVIIRATGIIGKETGWVMDLSEVSHKFEPIKNLIDHTLLNNIKGLENPTTENLALWILQEMSKTLPEISSVTVSSTDRIAVTIKREQLNY
jgi:6-pyruvoyltetrahydropterin/6-carboxytetrahydropterin synthase